MFLSWEFKQFVVSESFKADNLTLNTITEIRSKLNDTIFAIERYKRNGNDVFYFYEFLYPFKEMLTKTSLVDYSNHALEKIDIYMSEIEFKNLSFQSQDLLKSFRRFVEFRFKVETKIEDLNTKLKEVETLEEVEKLYKENFAIMELLIAEYDSIYTSKEIDLKKELKIIEKGLDKKID